jgi:hypothetical protein
MQTLFYYRHRYSSFSAGILLQRLTFVVLLCSAVITEDAAAKDLGALAEFVIPAYTAMDFAAVCAQDDPLFLQRTRGARGNALQYAEHIKDEAIKSLDRGEAITVLKAAAEAARNVARKQMRQLAPNYPAAIPGEIATWCHEVVSPFVRTIMERHEEGHAQLMTKIEQAKQ